MNLKNKIPTFIAFKIDAEDVTSMSLCVGLCCCNELFCKSIKKRIILVVYFCFVSND